MVYQFKTTKQRSNLMKRIKSVDTAPELALRRKLWGKGFRFSRRVSSLLGKPDIVLRKYKIAIFIDGELWHGYNWGEKKKKIKVNRSYWIPKIERTILRDRKNTRILQENGWAVVRFWQRSIDKRIEKCIEKVVRVARNRRRDN